MNELVIGDKVFTLSKNKDLFVAVDVCDKAGRTLEHYYIKPSLKKSHHYYLTQAWAERNNVLYFGVCSATNSHFAMQGYYRDKTGSYLLHIGYKLNLAYKLPL